MKASFIVALCLSVSAAATARSERLGLGLRGSFDGMGATAKYFFEHGFAIEGQLNAGGIRALEGQSYYLTTQIQYHLPLPLPALRLYFGGGAHAGAWLERPNAARRNELIFGLNGVCGIEYLLSKVPAGFSADLRPAVNYIQEVEFMPHNLVGVAARYYLRARSPKRPKL